MQGTASAPKKASSLKDENYIDINHLMSQLKEYGDKMDLMTDLDPLLENLQTNITQARQKQSEIEAIEYLAWSSDSEIVIDARKKLFAATKLAHGDFLRNYLEDLRDQNSKQYMVDDYEGLDPNMEFSSEKDWIKNSGTFLSRLRQTLRKKKEVRKLVKEFRKKMEDRSEFKANTLYGQTSQVSAKNYASLSKFKV